MAAREVFRPGSLRVAVAEVSRRALASGALVPIPTEHGFIDDGGVRFFVRVLAALARKEEERKERQREAAAGRPVNPFLPYEERLFVGDVTEGHVAILNKFNVVDRHLLIVTREFEDQRALLTPADFDAWWRCLVEYPSLGFYNGGVEAGASQPHKHLQLVPLPLGIDRRPTQRAAPPIEPLLDEGRPPFACARAPLAGRSERFAASPGDELAAVYRRLLAEVSLDAGSAPVGPYNLLLTRDWMLVVPRTREAWDGIPINALGFAGALLAPDRDTLARLSRCGPLRALAGVAAPPRELVGAER